MNRTRLYGIATAALLILNIILISFIYVGKIRHRSQEGPRDIIIERLHFDEAQVASYDKLIEDHTENIAKQDKAILETKRMLYENIRNAGDTELVSTLENDLGKLQIGVEKINYNHFRDIKNICKENQLAYFNDLMKDITILFNKPGPRQPRK